MKLHLVCCLLLQQSLTGYAGLQVERSKTAPEVRFIVFDEPLSGPRAPHISESRMYPEHQQRDWYGEQPSMPNFRFKPPDHINALPVQHNSRTLNHVEHWMRGPSGHMNINDMIDRYRAKRPLMQNGTLWKGRRNSIYKSLLEDYHKRKQTQYNVSRVTDPGLVRLGVHRIYYPGDQMPIEVKLKPHDDYHSYVVVISRSVPDVHNMTGSSGIGAQGLGEGLNTGRGSSAAGVSVPKAQSMYTYRVPTAYLPTDARHLFITVLMVHPGTGVDLNVYRRYKLVAIIGECRFLDEEEVDKSPNCKAVVIVGRTEIFCLCKDEWTSTRRRVDVVQATFPVTPKIQVREKFMPRKLEEKRLFQMPVLKPVENCTMAQRTYFHRLLQREFPLENIATAERLAVQIMQVESVLNNQTLYWTCNAFMPVDEDRVILEKSKLRSLSIRRLEQILSKHYQATPLVAAGTVMAMLGPSAEINFKVHEAAVETLHKSVEVLNKLPTKTRRALREMPGVIRSVLKGQSLILAHRGSMETREQQCKLSTSALSVMDDTVELVMQTQRGVEGPASFLSDGVSLWHSKVGVEALRKRQRYYVKPRLMLVYDEALYGFSKTLSVVVTVYRKNPFHCGSGLKLVSTDVVKPYIRDDATGMRIRGTPDHPRTLQVALAPDNANFEDTTNQLKASVMLIVKFKVPMEDGSVVVKLNPEFVKYFFMAFFQKDKEPETKDLTQDKMIILHPLATFMVILPEVYKVKGGDDVYVTFVPLVEDSVKSLGLNNIKYPFWHRSDMKIWYSVTAEHWSCVAKSGGDFSSEGCVMANVSTLGEIMCECQETGGGDAAIAARSHPVDFTTNLKPLVNVSSDKGGKKDSKQLNFYFIEHLIPILLAALWVNFVVLFYWTIKIAEIDEQTSATAVAPENKAGNKEVYILIFQTSYVQYAETTAKIQVELHGTEGTSGRFTLRDPRCNPYFLLAGSSNGLLLTTAQTLGNIIVLSIFSDSEGTRPSWHLKKIDVVHEGTPEKFLFVVDKWLRFQEQDRADILPFVEGHGKTFIIFKLNFMRMLRLCHLLYSVFAWPSGSRFSRVHRLITILFLGVISMFLVMLFQGFDPSSRTAPITWIIIIKVACLTAIIVFIAGVILQIIFTFSKQMPPRKVRLALRDSQADASKSARILTSTKYTEYTRNPEIKITYEVPEYRDESAVAGAKDQRSASLYEDRVEEGILPSPLLYAALLVALVVSVVLSAFMVPMGLKYGYEANVAWFQSLLLAIFLNNVIIDVLKSVGVTGYVATRRKK